MFAVACLPLPFHCSARILHRRHFNTSVCWRRGAALKRAEADLAPLLVPLQLGCRPVDGRVHGLNKLSHWHSI